MKNGKNKKRIQKRGSNAETSPLGRMEKSKKTGTRQTIQPPIKDTHKTRKRPIEKR